VATPASLTAAALRPAAQLGRRTVLFAVDASLSALDAALSSSLAQEVGERIRASDLADDLGDRLEPLLGRAVDSPEAERLVGRVIDSRVITAAIQQLLETDALWALVDEIAQSPAVTNAIGRQGISFADQLAGVMRNRSRTADDQLEHLARRLARRPSRDVGPASDAPAAEK
jgi:hypothetical protein